MGRPAKNRDKERKNRQNMYGKEIEMNMTPRQRKRYQKKENAAKAEIPKINRKYAKLKASRIRQLFGKSR